MLLSLLRLYQCFLGSIYCSFLTKCMAFLQGGGISISSLQLNIVRHLRKQFVLSRDTSWSDDRGLASTGAPTSFTILREPYLITTKVGMTGGGVFLFFFPPGKIFLSPSSCWASGCVFDSFFYQAQAGYIVGPLMS